MRTMMRIFEHMRWADNRTLTSLQSLSEPPEQAVDLYAHVLTAEHVWLARIQHRKPVYEVWQSLSLHECAQLSNENYDGYSTLLSHSDDVRLEAPVRYTNTSGREFQTALRDILLHVTHHGMYHRGQVALLVRAAGGTPLPTDLIVYVREPGK